MLDTESGTENTPTEKAAAAPRRRRAASRPAGAPAKVDPPALTAPPAPVAIDPAPAAPVAPAIDPVPAAAALEAAPEPQADEPTADLTPKRRRASTKVGEPATTRRRKVATPESPDEAPAAAEPTAVDSAVEAPTEEPQKPARRRATRKTAAPAPVEEPAAEAVAPAAEEVPEPAPEPVAEAPVVEAVIEEPKKPSRRRATRKSAAPEPAAPSDDPIGDRLREAEKLAEARKAVLADPFMTSEARQAELAALAGAIAADAPVDDGIVAEDAVEVVDEDEEIIEEGADAAQEDENEDIDSDDAEDSQDDDRPSRRRRRRGGRRRRRGRDEDADEDTPTDDESDEEPAEGGEEQAEGAEQADAEGAEEGSSTTRRRRRTRRRRGESEAGTSSDDEVTGIEGSTRMEAKRQRRKESRAAGRRRAPILSEAEFLARRESVDRRLVIRQNDDYTQLAVIEDNILVEHYVDKASATSLIGNIYVGRVQNVLPSMEAAFIDIGRGRNAVLYAGEVDWSAFGVTGEDRKVENVLKSGQSVLVQVTKDPVGAKGARLTGHISLPGRYVVYSPGGHLSGISRKLPDTERQRLRTVLGTLISDDESVIVRTAAEGASEEELIRDVNRLKAQWEVIEKKSKQGGAPQALYAEPDLTLRIVRDLFTEDFGHLVVQGNGGQDDAFDAISAYVSHVAPHLAERVERFEVGEDGRDLFAEYKVDEQIAKALDRKVYLPSGGSLVIDRTEAMTVVDVNTGRFTGSAGNLEATVTSNNLEAAEEIVRQLRLRDLGGIIVIDFIDMVLPSNRELLLRRLVECLGRDRTRHQVAEVTSLGLVQLTRKRIGTGLQEAFTEPCEHCHGAGYVRFDEPVDSQAPADGGERKPRRRRGK
ncbi:MAG: Rne/Rng family ribonuclease [Tessaracoccus sp.]|uniref:Rne/Rng family ribonuclease n=1 Tax=Tessaracoccus sp. TaxID=1971211 RepID=UPI001ECB312B|nr:Rne/Rng family ribonuclease [Tessaracoccus sp.]MBK7820846.1 Rne/Rng family ribonuclease [Tessaracoccus sp.]